MTIDVFGGDPHAFGVIPKQPECVIAPVAYQLAYTTSAGTGTRTATVVMVNAEALALGLGSAADGTQPVLLGEKSVVPFHGNSVLVLQEVAPTFLAVGGDVGASVGVVTRATVGTDTAGFGLVADEDFDGQCFATLGAYFFDHEYMDQDRSEVKK